MKSKSERNSRGKQREEVIFPVAPSKVGLPSDYVKILGDIKKRIAETRLRTVLAANTQMVLLYWDIGNLILKRQNKEGWGARTIDRLSQDLKNSFPDMSGFSPRNLKYMKAFAEAWPDAAIVQRCVAQLPWRSNVALLDKLSDQKIRLELGAGFAFVGRQVHLEVGDSDYYLDLLFYHTKLHCYVVIPTIGLLLCKSKNKLVVEYALRDLNKPIGVAGWETKIVKSLPKNWMGFCRRSKKSKRN